MTRNDVWTTGSASKSGAVPSIIMGFMAIGSPINAQIRNLSIGGGASASSLMVRWGSSSDYRRLHHHHSLAHIWLWCVVTNACQTASLYLGSVISSHSTRAGRDLALLVMAPHTSNEMNVSERWIGNCGYKFAMFSLSDAIMSQREKTISILPRHTVSLLQIWQQCMSFWRNVHPYFVTVVTRDSQLQLRMEKLDLRYKCPRHVCDLYK